MEGGPAEDGLLPFYLNICQNPFLRDEISFPKTPKFMKKVYRTFHDKGLTNTYVMLCQKSLPGTGWCVKPPSDAQSFPNPPPLTQVAVSRLYSCVTLACVAQW